MTDRRKTRNGNKVCVSCSFTCTYQEADKHFSRTKNEQLAPYCNKKGCDSVYFKSVYELKKSKELPEAQRKLLRIQQVRNLFNLWVYYGGGFGNKIIGDQK